MFDGQTTAGHEIGSPRLGMSAARASRDLLSPTHGICQSIRLSGSGCLGLLMDLMEHLSFVDNVGSGRMELMMDLGFVLAEKGHAKNVLAGVIRSPSNWPLRNILRLLWLILCLSLRQIAVV